MRSFISLVAFFVWCSIFSIGRVSAQSFPEPFLEVPSCALLCLIRSLPESGCPLTDIECQCQSQRLVEITYECMLDPCLISEKLALMRARSEVCNIPSDDSRGTRIVITTAILIAISGVLVIIKVLSRLISDHTLFFAEWLVLATEMCAFAGCGIVFWLVANGYGSHTYYMSSAHVAKVFLRYYAVETVYLVCILLAKLAVLYLYLELFPGKWTRLATKCTMGLVILSSITIVIVQLNQCNPIPKAWNKDLPGTCLELNEIVMASAGINIGQDALILLIPIPVLVNLTIPLKQKVSMLIIFSLYSFALCTSIVRINFVQGLGKYLIDPAYDDGPATLWSIIDVHVSIICACLPSLPGSIRRLCMCTRRTRNSQYNHSHISLRSSSPNTIDEARKSGSRWSRQQPPALRIPDEVHAQELKDVSGKEPGTAVTTTEIEGGDRTHISTRWSQTTFTPSTWNTPTTPTKMKGGLGSLDEVSQGNDFSMNRSKPIDWDIERRAGNDRQSHEISFNRSQPIDWDVEGQRERDMIGMAYSPETDRSRWSRADEDAIGLAS